MDFDGFEFIVATVKSQWIIATVTETHAWCFPLQNFSLIKFLLDLQLRFQLTEANLQKSTCRRLDLKSLLLIAVDLGGKEENSCLPQYLLTRK